MGAAAARGSTWASRRAVLTAICAGALIGAARVSEADERAASEPAKEPVSRLSQESVGGAQASPRADDPFARGALGVELAGGVYGEAWNFNGSTEGLVDGSAGVWWTFLDGAMLVVEFHATRVFQRSSHNAFVNALTPVLRFRLVGRPSWQLFADVAGGISWSDIDVPPRGTRFNYLALAGCGVLRRLGRQSRLVASFRWVHLSNAGREGRERNPDVEALGGFAGVNVAF